MRPKSIGWLHLTDLHRGMTFQSCLWPNVEREFFGDLEKLHKVCGPWDLIFWTGDLVQKGEASEFTKFSGTLERLYSRLRALGSEPVLVTIPGNHDLTRPDLSPSESELLERWADEPTISLEFWNDRSPLTPIVKKAFRNYSIWEKRHSFPRPDNLLRGKTPGDCAASVSVNGMEIGILGLNTAFLQLTAGEYEAKLAVGLEQMSAVCGENFTDWFDQHHLCFLMTHHPPDWLNKVAKDELFGEIAIPGRFIAQLCGHLHESFTMSRSIGGASNQRIWQGSSLFGLELFGKDKVRRHGYCAGRVEILGKTGQIRLWPRIAQRHQARYWHFVQDNSVSLASDGGTLAEEFVVSAVPEIKASPLAKKKSVYRVLLLSTNGDLQEARQAAALHLKKSLGVHVDETSVGHGERHDVAVLLQAWRWEGGAIVNRWLEYPVSKRVAFLVSEDSNWPPYKLIELDSHDKIAEFRTSVTDGRYFAGPDEIPEVVGAIVTARLQQHSGSQTAGLRDFERSYLEFRVPIWRSGRTALSQPHLFVPADAKELYQPDLYTALDGISVGWRADKNGRPKRATKRPKREAEIHVREQDLRIRLARWLTVPDLPRISLIGAPGGGKTVFLTRIAAALGSTCLGRPVEFEPDLEIEQLRGESSLPIPVVIEATRIAQHDMSTIAALLGAIEDELFSSGTFRPTPEEIEEALKSGRYYLLVDALDEVAGSRARAAVLQLLKDVASLYPDTRVLLTTRSARYTGTLSFGPEYESVQIASLDERQVERICGNWARNRQHDVEYRAMLRAAVSGLAEQMSTSSSDQPLTENPLMLTAICMVFERYRSLPDDRGRLCELLIEDLCRSRRSEDLEREWKLDEAGKKDLLQRIALAMQEEGAQTWPFDRAVGIALQLIPKSEVSPKDRARRYVDWAADHTGILRFVETKGEQEQIRFWHRLFREYLCASRLAQEDSTAGDKIDRLWKKGRLSDPFWDDVIRLFPRTLGTIEKAHSVRERLNELATANKLQRGRLLGLSAASVIENRDLFPDVNLTSTVTTMAEIFEAEGDKWTLTDRLLFLDALGRLDRSSGDPRMKTERWVEPRSGGAFVVHYDVRGKKLECAFGFAPVTVQEFWRFTKSEAFLDDAHWKGAPLSVLHARSELIGIVQAQMRHPNWPVAMVSLYAALAYCSWRTSSRNDSKFVRLPQTSEWRKFVSSSPQAKQLARTPKWPKGDKAMLNWREAGLGHPSPVGAFALRVCGAADVLGNVWQWILPSSGEPFYSYDGKDRLRTCPVGGLGYNSGGHRRFR